MPKAVILFDGVCNLCNSSVQFVIKHDKNKYFNFASLQSDYGQEVLEKNNLNKQDYNSFILLDSNVLYKESTAALKVSKHLRFPVSLLYVFIIVPPFIRNIVYGFIARNRYKWFGKKDQCMIPSPDLKSRFLD